MWLLSWVPDSFLEHMINGVLILGTVSTLLTFFVINRLLRWYPPLGRWVNLAQIVSAAVLLAGVYFKGSYQTEAEWRARVAEAEAKVAAAEEASKKVNGKLDKQAKDRVRVIYQRGTIVRQYIDREVVKYDDACKIPDVVVRAHNAAAKNEEIK
jgi:DNA-binding protein YbaB